MKKIFAANWKLQKNPHEAMAFCETLKKDLPKDFFLQRELFIFPQNFSLYSVAESLKNTSVFFGPQNIHTELSGAFTGENSAQFAKDLGARSVLLGHSERRQYFHENDADLAKKIILAQKLQMVPIFCIGETLQQRQQDLTESICFQQIQDALSTIDKNQRIILAYEPVWAIGTGQVASPQQVAEVHASLNQKMQQMKFTDFQILYGGSVKPDNAAELIQIPYVDGFLIGGASLEVASFLKIASI